MTLVKLILDVKDSTWINANQSKVLSLKEPLFRDNGTVAYGDGVTPLSGLDFVPIFSESGIFTWGLGNGDITNQTDLVDYINNAIPNVEYAQSSTNTISFTQNTIYGTIETPLTGSLGFVYPGIRGAYAIIIHNDSVAPGFDTWKRIEGSYSTSQTNYIIAQYLSETNIIYSIKQIQ